MIAENCSVTWYQKQTEKPQKQLETRIVAGHKCKGPQQNMNNYNLTIIYHDQLGFIPKIQGWINIYNSINIKHHINKRNIKSYDNNNRCRESVRQIQEPICDIYSQ